jgi:hypothetical protein
MSVSEARLIANRQNSAKSTGPKTPEGKERSRCNGLKHGMAGEGVVIPADDLAEVERRAETLQAELDPKTAIGVILVRQLATLSVRMERGAKQEFAAIASRVRHASENFDQDRGDRAESLFVSIVDDPRKHLELLRRSPEGVARLVKAWTELRLDLSRAGATAWSPGHLEKMANLRGLAGNGLVGSWLEALTRATWGNLASLEDHERTGVDPQSRRPWARLALIERIDTEIAGLEAHLATLDLDLIEQDRAEAGDRALFDPSKEATLARRYESEARRCFFKSLNEFRQVEAESPGRNEVIEAADSNRESAPVASSRENLAATDRDQRMIPGHAPRTDDRSQRSAPKGEIERETRRAKAPRVALAVG